MVERLDRKVLTELKKTQDQMASLVDSFTALHDEFTAHMNNPLPDHNAFVPYSLVGTSDPVEPDPNAPVRYAPANHQHALEYMGFTEVNFQQNFTRVADIIDTAQSRVDALAEVTMEVALDETYLMHPTEIAQLVADNPSASYVPSNAAGFRTIYNKFQTISHDAGDLILLEFAGVLGPSSTETTNQFNSIRAFLLKLDVTTPTSFEGPWEGFKYNEDSGVPSTRVRAEAQTVMSFVAPHTGTSQVRTGIHYGFEANANFYPLDTETNKFQGYPRAVFRVRKMGNVYGNY